MRDSEDTSIWPEPRRPFAHLKMFIVSLCTVLSLFVVAIFAFLYWRTDDLLLQRLREQAVAYHDFVMHAWDWNSGYGGVYALKRSNVESNIYLRRLGINPDTVAKDGRMFTMRNHAIMINEISRMSELKDGTTFRITSLKPIDPENAPDQFEMEALEKFVHREREFSRIENPPGKPSVFRYLKPLKADRTCLECHRSQGYTVGSVVGAVSISIPVEKILREAQTSKILLIVAALLVLGLLLGISYFLIWRLAKRLDRVQQRYISLIATDELTKVRSRRFVLQRFEEECERAGRLGTQLSLMLVDIDHFKRINDTYGHPFGDQVLKGAAALMKRSLRRYDVLGRIGGEEFLIVSPGATSEEAAALAERIRFGIKEMKVVTGDKECSVTVSIGVAAFSREEGCGDQLMHRVDAALYRAKDEGRNRVVSG